MKSRGFDRVSEARKGVLRRFIKSQGLFRGSQRRSRGSKMVLGCVWWISGVFHEVSGNINGIYQESQQD